MSISSAPRYLFLEELKMKAHKEYKPEELAEAYIFPDVLTGSERDEVLSVFRQFRKETSAHQSTESKHLNRLLQLKFLMEDDFKLTQVD